MKAGWSGLRIEPAHRRSASTRICGMPVPSFRLPSATRTRPAHIRSDRAPQPAGRSVASVTPRASSGRLATDHHGLEALNDAAVIAIFAIIEVNDTQGGEVGTLTIRNLDDPLKSRLRLRAAARNRSMEEEARQILRAALQEPVALAQDLGTRIRARFTALGDVQLAVESREPVRQSPDFRGPPPAAPSAARKAKSGRR